MSLSGTLLTVAVCLLDMAMSANKLPPSFKRCARSDPKYDDCMGKAIEDAVRQMKQGEPDLGIYPLDPLEIPHLEIRQGDGPVKLDLIFDNIKIYGISDSVVTYSKCDMVKQEMKINAYTDTLRLESDYKVDGQVLVLPVKGDGKCNVTLAPLTSHFYTKGETFEKNGVKYMKQTVFDYKLDPKKMYMDFENLFGGDKVLGDTINRFINENWQDVFKEIKPGMEEALSLVFLNIANRIYSKVPYDDVFPNEI